MPKRTDPNSVEEELQRSREQAIEELQRETNEENLWKAVVAFQGYSFFTASGLPYCYTLKVGKNGTYNKELIVDRRKESKTLSWSSVTLAFRAALEQKGTLISRPKALGDIRGISYIYPLLYHFGLIEVPEKYATAIRGGVVEL